MRWLLCLGLGTLVAASQSAGGSIDVSTLAVGAPATVAALDTGKLKGDPIQLAWSDDGKQCHVQTKEHNGKVSHYLVALEGGAVANVDSEPAWAREYWKFKQDRYAPGVQSLVIDVKQKYESQRYGTGSAGALDRESSPAGGDNRTVGTNLTRDTTHSTQHVITLVLLDQTIGTWVDETPTPGTTFGWGPSGSGAIAFVDEHGQLVLFDNHGHKQPVANTRDVSLPAWSMDGSRLAYVSKAGKNKYMLNWSTVTRP